MPRHALSFYKASSNYVNMFSVVRRSVSHTFLAREVFESPEGPSATEVNNEFGSSSIQPAGTAFTFSVGRLAALFYESSVFGLWKLNSVQLVPEYCGK